MTVLQQLMRYFLDMTSYDFSDLNLHLPHEFNCNFNCFSFVFFLLFFLTFLSVAFFLLPIFIYVTIKLLTINKELKFSQILTSFCVFFCRPFSVIFCFFFKCVNTTLVLCTSPAVCLTIP